MSIGLIFTLILAVIYGKAHSIDKNEEIERCKKQTESTIAHYEIMVENVAAERDLACENEQAAHGLARNELAGEWEKLKWHKVGSKKPSRRSKHSISKLTV